MIIGDDQGDLGGGFEPGGDGLAGAHVGGGLNYGELIADVEGHIAGAVEGGEGDPGGVDVDDLALANDGDGGNAGEVVPDALQIDQRSVEGMVERLLGGRQGLALCQGRGDAGVVVIAVEVVG